MLDEQEYKNHKIKCSNSFDNIESRLDRFERALFGEPELKRKGMVEMIESVYGSFTMARGSERVFVTIVKISGGILSIIGAFWAIYEFLHRVVISK